MHCQSDCKDKIQRLQNNRPLDNKTHLRQLYNRVYAWWHHVSKTTLTFKASLHQRYHWKWKVYAYRDSMLYFKP